MKNKKALMESGKNLIIILLLISAVFLLFKAMLFEPDTLLENLSSILGVQPAGSAMEMGQTELITSAASPCYVLATTADGHHYAAKYDGANKEKLTAQFSSYLGEALGSANAPVQITEEQWRSALGKSGVFFDYVYPQPLSAMASWLGTTLSGSAGEHSARRLYLGNSDGALSLFYIDESDYSIYRCSTALSFSTLSAKIAELPTGSASFAFEQGDAYKGIDPYFIFSDETAQLRAMTSVNPLRDGFSSAELLSLFSMNSRTTLNHTESDGSAVYVDSDKSLQLDGTGKLTFSVTDGTGIIIPRGKSELTLSDCITLVNSIAQQSVGANCGEAEVGLSGVSNAATPGACTLYFNYFIDGVPVTLSGGAHALRAQISSGTVVRIDMVFRSYSHTGEMLIPLPEKQACAIADTIGAEPLLRYEDKADGVSCNWFAN